MMKSRKSILLLLLISLCYFSFSLPNNIKKKVYKEIQKTFDTSNVVLKPIIIDDKINKQLSKRIGTDNLFRIEHNSTLLGYAYVDKAASKTDEFDYLVLLDEHLIVVKTKVLIYRENYGNEIGSRRWLKQFIGKTLSDKLIYQKDIMAISGATISATSMTLAVNQFFRNLEILHENKIL